MKRAFHWLGDIKRTWTSCRLTPICPYNLRIWQVLAPGLPYSWPAVTTPTSPSPNPPPNSRPLRRTSSIVLCGLPACYARYSMRKREMEGEGGVGWTREERGKSKTSIICCAWMMCTFPHANSYTEVYIQSVFTTNAYNSQFSQKHTIL